MKTLLEKMKYVLMFSLALVILTQCGGDDEGDTNENDLIGTWTVSAVTFESDIGGQTITQFFMDAGLDEATAQALADAFEEGFDGNITFNKDNTYESSFDGDIETGTWTLSSDGMTMTLDPVDDDILMLDVVTLNSNTLIIALTETENEDFDGDGTEETLTITVQISFDKAS